MMLAFDGHQVETAGSGKDALALFTKDKYDVVITDYAMPAMKGDELAVAIKSLAPEQPVVLITAYAEMLKSAAGIDLTHIPYRGEAPAIPDLVAGRIDLMFLTTAKPLIDDGRVIGLGHTADGPWFNLPGVKPLTELGLRDFVVPGWNGLMAPNGTPPAVIAKLSEALSMALKSEASVRAFNAMGFKPGSGMPGPMKHQIEADMRLFTTVIRERNLKFDT